MKPQLSNSNSSPKRKDKNKNRDSTKVTKIPKIYFQVPNKGKTAVHQKAEDAKLLDKVPDYMIKRTNMKSMVKIAGPYGVEQPTYEFSRSFGCTISTYPFYPSHSSRQGDPICDSYRIHTFENMILFCLADGCNWGERPRDASNKAKDAFVYYVQDKISECKTLKEVSMLLVNALSVAHNVVIHGKEDVWMAGTTTLLGGLIIELEDGPNIPKWMFLSISVGDCKAFLYNFQNQDTFDITAGNRKNLTDPRDPGGRIGPYMGDGDPDLRNLDLYFTPCNENDIILIVSDGVHDNLDPQTLGKSPLEFGLETDDWEKVDYEKGTAVKIKYMNNFITSIMRKDDGDLISPKVLSKKLIRHCMECTGAGRQFMEQNPNTALEHDYVKYPGKMDHTTCVAVKVGRFNPNVKEDNISESLNPVIWPF